jgi:glycosyltransferase involved in cell wall biosynthesis
MKKISVIIAAYDAKEYLADSVTSVLIQKLPDNYNLELIVGIDGCLKTWEVIPYMRHKLVKYVKMADNYGTYVTFNTLMKFASGDLIARFDADDLMLPDYLFKQICLLDSNNNIDITKSWSIETNLNNFPVLVLLPDGKFTFKIKGKERFWNHGQIVMKRRVWDALGSYKPWPCTADTDFNGRAKLCNFGIYQLKEFLYLRRIHNQSLTRHKETGLGSAMRESYQTIMKQDFEKHKLAENFYVNPTIGYIEKVVS